MNPATAMLASTAVSAVSSIQAGRYAKAAAEAEAQQYKEQQEMAKIQALEDAAAREAEMNRINSANLALAASKGYEPWESASFLALREENIEESQWDIAGVRLMGLANVRKYGLGAFESKMSGKAAMWSAYGQAGSTMLGGYSKWKQAQIPAPAASVNT